MPGWSGVVFEGMFMIVFWVLVILGNFLLVFGFTGRSSTGRPAERPESPIERPGCRDEKGEIDQPAFEQWKKDLRE